MRILVRCISRSLSSVEAPKRNQSGSSQSAPAISLTVDEVLDRVLGRADAAGRLHADHLPGGLAEVADRLEHHQRHRQRRGGLDLAGGGLDEVAAGDHRQPAGPADVVVGLELAGLEDHLEVAPLAAGLATATISSKTSMVAPGEERAAVDHHVDLVGPGVDGVLDVGELDVAAPRGRSGRRWPRRRCARRRTPSVSFANGTMSG